MALKIGVPTAIYDNTFGSNKYYLNWLEKFGQPFLLTPYLDQSKYFDVLFLPGGADIWQTKLTYLNNRPNPHLDWFANFYLQEFVNTNRPIFGICAGMQRIAVYFGGTLKNLLGDNLKLHNQGSNDEEKTSLVHDVIIDDKDNLNIRGVRTNSIHHQAVEYLPTCLNMLGKSRASDVIEVVRHKTLPIAGVQWHPEKINDLYSEHLFKEILR